MPTGNLPESGKKLFEEVYQKALKGSCKDNSDPKGCAAGSAWKAVHNAGWKKDAQGNWHKSEVFTEFSMRIERAIYDKATNERRVKIVASDTDTDKRGDSMSLELFNDFIQRINNNDPVPEEFRSNFWQGGEPYISVSHYPDMDGKYAPGVIDATYIDGNYLKSKGRFSDTPLGRKCFEAICSELYGDNKGREDKVRISIAFLDYMHKHKSNGFTFDRVKADLPFCPECLKEMLTGESQGLVFLKGQLIHEALTRVPVNTRTSMEVDKSMANKIITRKDDAASIVGDELADELDKEMKLIGKSDALVIKSDEPVTVIEEIVNAPVIDETETDENGNPIEKSEMGDMEKECMDEKTGKPDPDCMKKKKAAMAKKKSDVIPVAIVNPIAVDVNEPYEPPLPFGGATSLKDAIALQEAKKTMWDIEDLWYMVQTVKDNIMASDEVTDKGKALGSLLEEFKKEIKSKSETVEVDTMTKDEITAIIKSSIAELMPKPIEPVAHPLDATFTAFKAKFDEIVKSETTEDVKLHSIQEPFNALGTEIVTIVKSSVKTVTPNPEAPAQSDIGKAVTEALNPLTQQLALLITQLSTPMPERVAPVIPARRSIPPSTLIQQPQVAKSETPNLRKIIEQSVP